MTKHAWPLLPGALALVLLLCVTPGCYRRDPLYCDGQTACAEGFTCAMPAHECRSGTGNPDMPLPPGDMATDMSGDTGGPAPCTRNYQCPGSACDPTGSCHDPSRIIVVDDDPAKCKTGVAPYCNVQDALMDSGLGKSKDLILVLPSTGPGHSHNGDYLDIGTTVRIVGARTGPRDTPPLLRDPVRIRGASLAGDIQVDLEDLTLAPTGSGNVSAVECVRSAGNRNVKLGVRFSRLSQAPEWGAFVQSCTPLTLIGNQVLDNGKSGTLNLSGGGLQLAETVFTAFDNVVANNGTIVSQGSGVMLLGNLGASQFAFNTVANNACQGVMGCGMRCPASSGFPATYTIAVGANAVAVDCKLDRSVVPMDYQGTATDVKIAPDFVDPANGDYHLKMTNNNKMLRLPEQNPVVTYDLDGNPRPASGMVDIGAYQLP